MNDQKILCPHPNCNAEMEVTKEDIICHKCGYVVSIEWLINIYFVVHKTLDAKNTIENGKELKVTVE